MSNLVIKTGDITEESCDCIVNAANSSLLGGGGVDGAIHLKAGPALDRSCRWMRHHRYPDGLPPGEAVATTAGNLPARFVIHTVGPVYGQNAHPEETLASCYRNTLQLAAHLGCRTIAIPAISTGVYGFPKEAAARVVAEVIESLSGTALPSEIRLVFHNDRDREIFEHVLAISA